MIASFLQITFGLAELVIELIIRYYVQKNAGEKHLRISATLINSPNRLIFDRYTFYNNKKQIEWRAFIMLQLYGSLQV